MTEVTGWQLLSYVLVPWIIFGLIWLQRNRKDIGNKWRLWWNKSRAIKANLITVSGRTEEHICIPDARGAIDLKGGTYVYHKEAATINAKLGIPEVTFIECQPHTPTPHIIADKVIQTGQFHNKTPEGPPVPTLEADVPVIQKDGSVRGEKLPVPVFMLAWTRAKAQKLEGKTAQEIRGMLHNKIVDDIAKATAKTMQKLDLMFILICIITGLLVLGGFAMWTVMNDINTKLDIVTNMLNTPRVSGP